MSRRKYPYFIDWAITAKCNLHCRHCRGMTSGEVSNERAEELVTEIAALKPAWVILEGGEPLLRPDLFEILGLMRQAKLEVHLISNGMCLTEEHLSILKGLDIKLMISIDGATPATYERVREGASFDKVVASAQKAAEAGILEAINTAVLKMNYNEIPTLFHLARSIGVNKINIIGLKPCQGYPTELLTPDEYRWVIRETCRASLETEIEFFFDEPFFWATVKEEGLSAHLPEKDAGILLPSKSECIFGEYLFIEPSGDVKPCSFAPLVLGNVTEKTLGEIWQEMCISPFFKSIIDASSRTGYCRECEYLSDCKGCRSRTFVLTGDWFASDPACPLSPKLVEKES
ncbi:MAG: radical SAM protein [Chloroflexota bacterium]